MVSNQRSQSRLMVTAGILVACNSLICSKTLLPSNGDAVLFSNLHTLFTLSIIQFYHQLLSSGSIIRLHLLHLYIHGLSETLSHRLPFIALQLTIYTAGQMELDTLFVQMNRENGWCLVRLANDSK